MQSRRFVMVEPVTSNNPQDEIKYVYLVIDPSSLSVESFSSPGEAWGYIHLLENQENTDENTILEPGR